MCNALHTDHRTEQLVPDFRKVAEAYFADRHDQALEQWVETRRSQDPPAPWRRIVVELAEMTDGVVDVAPQTLINWYGDVDREPAA